MTNTTTPAMSGTLAGELREQAAWLDEGANEWEGGNDAVDIAGRARTVSVALYDIAAELTAPADADKLAAQAEHDARTMAPPVPGVTQNAGYTVRAVIHAHDAERGLLGAWWVACENADTGHWVTWNAYAGDPAGSQAGRLSYDGGDYFDAPSGPSGLARADNKRRALADLAVRAGTMTSVALRIADGALHDPHAEPEDKRMARRLRKWATR